MKKPRRRCKGLLLRVVLPADRRGGKRSFELRKAQGGARILTGLLCSASIPFPLNAGNFSSQSPLKLEFGCELFSRELRKEGRQEADAIFLLPPAGALEPFCGCLEAAEAAARGSLDCSFGHVFLNFRPAVAASRVVVLPMGHFFKVLGPAWSLLLHPHPQHFKSAYFPALNAFCLKALNPDTSVRAAV